MVEVAGAAVAWVRAPAYDARHGSEDALYRGVSLL